MKYDWKSMLIGFLVGFCLLLLMGQAPRKDAVDHYILTTGNSTWVIDSITGDTWELSGERISGVSKYSWTYAGKPSGTTAGQSVSY